jgi:hypothetical protein
MNTCAQPPEGAGGSRSKAAGELTLGLLSGGGAVYADGFFAFRRSEPVREGGLTVNDVY